MHLQLRPQGQLIMKKTLHTGIEHSMFDACMKRFCIIVLMSAAARKQDIFVSVFTTRNVSRYSQF